jgi:hypothetical protein
MAKLASIMKMAAKMAKAKIGEKPKKEISSSKAESQRISENGWRGVGGGSSGSGEEGISIKSASMKKNRR